MSWNLSVLGVPFTSYTDTVTGAAILAGTGAISATGTIIVSGAVVTGAAILAGVGGITVTGYHNRPAADGRRTYVLNLDKARVSYVPAEKVNLVEVT